MIYKPAEQFMTLNLNSFTIRNTDKDCIFVTAKNIKHNTK